MALEVPFCDAHCEIRNVHCETNGCILMATIRTSANFTQANILSKYFGQGIYAVGLAAAMPSKGLMH